MRVLIAEDDSASRIFLFKFLSQYGECDITVDGKEAIEAFALALDENNPYDLVCLDVMMPEIDGFAVLRAIRKLEKSREIDEKKRSRIIMTTALNETHHVFGAFDSGCEAYAAKPINVEKFTEVMQKLGLIP